MKKTNDDCKDKLSSDIYIIVQQKKEYKNIKKFYGQKLTRFNFKNFFFYVYKYEEEEEIFFIS